MIRKLKISAIVTLYKDELAIPYMKDRLEKTFRRIETDYEIIFVNDGSPDNCQEVLEKFAANDTRIKVITHSRNFGSQNAFTSGLRASVGDACVLLDGDLQDPPELIADFFKKWREGYDVVYGVRVRRQMPRVWDLIYKAFYRFFQKVAYIPIPLDAGDFSLIDRKVVNVLNRLPERDRFLRGLRAWTGFRQVGVPYKRPERMFGRSTNNLWANIRWARKAIFSFSVVPIEMISVCAISISGLLAVAVVAQTVHRLLRPDLPHGVSTIIIVCLLVGSVQLFSIAFLAEYIGKILDETKRRPLYIIAKTINLSPVQRDQITAESEVMPLPDPEFTASSITS